MKITFADLTTTHVGGVAKHYKKTSTADEFIDAIRVAHQNDMQVLVVGEGSNLLVSDDGFDGLTIQDGRSNVEIHHSEDETVYLKVSAGSKWDTVVRRSLELGLCGLESLAAIPGTAGAAPVQNIGAYGYEVAPMIDSVSLYDIENDILEVRKYQDFNPVYRSSDLKVNPGKYAVVDVFFKLKKSNLSLPIKYPQLAGALDAQAGERVNTQTLYKTVKKIRENKGMIHNEDDHDTWSSGSFFTNPVVTKSFVKTLPHDLPRYEADKGFVKLSAAWMIEHAGFPKGYALPHSNNRATLSNKHTLAITNRGDATTKDIVDLARHVKEGVKDKYGVDLHPEPVCVGFAI